MKRKFLLVGGHKDGEWVALMHDRMHYIVWLPQPPLSYLAYAGSPPDLPSIPASVEYAPVHGVHGALALRGTSPELVIDLLVDGYRRTSK